MKEVAIRPREKYDKVGTTFLSSGLEYCLVIEDIKLIKVRR